VDIAEANGTLDRRALARQPQQLRARERFDLVLSGAREILRKDGLTGFSIPALAQRVGITRASIYKFFPTPYAVLNELVRRGLEQLDARLTARAQKVSDRPWPEALRAVTFEAVAFYNDDPVSRLLILGGPVTDDSYRVQELAIQKLGGLTRALLETRGIELPRSKPDAAMLLVDIGTTCFRVSQFLHGEITDEYRMEAVHAMHAYLLRFTGPAPKSSHREDK